MNKLIILFFLLTPIMCKAQGNNDLQNSLNGSISDIIENHTISYVHIFSESKRLNILGSENGQFQIPASPGDTLLFTCMGYEPLVYFVKSNDFKDSLLIKLNPKTYSLEKIDIQIPTTYNEFKQKIISMNIKDNKLNISGLPKWKDNKPPLVEQKKYVKSPGFLLSSPVSFFYYNFSKTEQSKQRMHEIIEFSDKQKIIDQRYNRTVVKNITGLSEDEISNFMSFCNFSNDFILSLSDYQMGVAIKQKLSVYKEELEKQKKEKK